MKILRRHVKSLKSKLPQETCNKRCKAPPKGQTPDISRASTGCRQEWANHTTTWSDFSTRPNVGEGKDFAAVHNCCDLLWRWANEGGASAKISSSITPSYVLGTREMLFRKRDRWMLLPSQSQHTSAAACEKGRPAASSHATSPPTLSIKY